MCSGYIAATEAAKSLKQNAKIPPIDREAVYLEKERIFRPMKNLNGMHYDQFESAIRQVMKYYMSYVRNQKGMEIALERLSLIESYLDTVMASNYHELMRTNEAVHLLRICRLATRASMERKESGRAIYRRSDYPDRDEAYAKILAMWQKDGQAQLSWL